MASLRNSRDTSISTSSSASGNEPPPELPAGTEVYRINRSALGYGDLWTYHRGWSVLGAWLRKVTRLGWRDSDRVVHIEDHRSVEVAKDDLPTRVQSAIFPLVDESLKLGFCDFRYGRYFDPFNRLEFITVYAVHPEKSAVLRISRKVAADHGHTLQVELEISSIFPDGSMLVTTSEAPRLRGPVAEKRTVRKDAGPRELWSRHTKGLAAIPYQPKRTPNAEAAWNLTNELEFGRARFQLSRGFYAERSLVECARDALRLLNGEFARTTAMEASRAERKSENCSFFSIAQLSGAVAVAVAICMISADLQPTHSMPPLTASQKRRLAQKGQVKAPAQPPRPAAADPRDSR